MKNLLILFICFLSVQFIFGQPAQDRARLEKERQDIQKELQDIQSAYNKVKGKTKATLGQVYILQRKLNVQDRYIGNINKEIHSITDDIYLSTLEINHLQRQLDTLKAEYARSVVYAYKNKSSYDYLNFIFSANSFNDALKRVSYLKSYRAYRQQQVANILETQKLIQQKKQQLLGKQVQKKSALQNQQQQLAELENQKKEKDIVVSKLKSQAKDLARQIAVKRKRDKQLRNQIAAVIRKALAEAKRQAEANKSRATVNINPTTNTTTNKTTARPNYLNLNAADVALNASFEKNRGRLPWPVDNGVVTLPFGESKVGGLDIYNGCITISTPSVGTPVKSVFSGEVSAVTNSGEDMTVIIRHGKYFTVYSVLSSVSVNKGETVKSGQVIGRTGQSDDGTGGQLDFYLMDGMKNINPQPWLHR